MPAVRISRALTCEVGFVAARVRLVKLLHLGYLHHACGTAFGSGTAVLPDHGLGNQLPLELEMVSIAEPESGRGAVRLRVSWHARAADRSRRVLDAELALGASEGGTGVRLNGSFRPPLPPAGSASDLAQLGAAAACAESLLQQLAEALIWSDDRWECRPGWHWVNRGTPTPPTRLPAEGFESSGQLQVTTACRTILAKHLGRRRATSSG